MAVTVSIAATLRSFTDRDAKIELEGGSVEEIYLYTAQLLFWRIMRLRYWKR